jgi:hypothetical protein
VSGAGGKRDEDDSHTNIAQIVTQSSAKNIANVNANNNAARKRTQHAESGARSPVRESKTSSQAAIEVGGAADASTASTFPALPGGLGGNRGQDCERAGHAVRLSVLPAIASRSRASTRIPEIPARTVGEIAPRRRVKEKVTERACHGR